MNSEASGTPILKFNSYALLMVRVACVLLLIGRAWQHLFWDAPFRALLWSQSAMEGVVKTLWGMDWESYASNPATSDAIQRIIQGFGVFYLIAAVAAMLYPAGLKANGRRWLAGILVLASLSLFFLGYLYYRDKVLRLGEWGEYACQFSAPILLLLLASGRADIAGWWMRVAVALTFACHGLYAIGFYPMPGEWVTMTMECLGCRDDQAVVLLKYAGILDMAVAVLVFFPGRLQMLALAYAVFWGFLTALARPWTFSEPANFLESLGYWGWEFLVRTPHFLLPLAALALACTARKSASIKDLQPTLSSPQTE